MFLTGLYHFPVVSLLLLLPSNSSMLPFHLPLSFSPLRTRESEAIIIIIVQNIKANFIIQNDCTKHKCQFYYTSYCTEIFETDILSDISQYNQPNRSDISLLIIDIQCSGLQAINCQQVIDSNKSKLNRSAIIDARTTANKRSIFIPQSSILEIIHIQAIDTFKRVPCDCDWRFRFQIETKSKCCNRCTYLR